MSFPKPFYRWRPHPWHGLTPGVRSPDVVNAFIELTPFDSVKLEVDKETGYLRVDRPQTTSSQPPALYGFIPRTYCDTRVQALCPTSERGDKDPLDICVLSERLIDRPEILLNAIVVGGLQMVDGGEADDKIVAVLENDHVYGGARDISDIPPILVDRLRHYFLTYKQLNPTASKSSVSIEKVYGADHAKRVIAAAVDDYEQAFGS
ncbi:MAG: inorganic pyrophosphatase [Sandaracinus sp.]|nr:inorganic pyrophosphatase [Sandaracinus sp.]|tara:strand:+ start:182 stop:799 length:618 start_codon:yes stop_codon:yes gene_type:complete